MTYLGWLISEIHGEEYTFLLKKLSEIDFYWSDRIPIDENLAKDGLALRDEYDILAVSEGWETEKRDILTKIGSKNRVLCSK